MVKPGKSGRSWDSKCGKRKSNRAEKEGGGMLESEER
jgi:hypothetical protein